MNKETQDGYKMDKYHITADDACLLYTKKNKMILQLFFQKGSQVLFNNISGLTILS